MCRWGWGNGLVSNKIFVFEYKGFNLNVYYIENFRCGSICNFSIFNVRLEGEGGFLDFSLIS